MKVRLEPIKLPKGKFLDEAKLKRAIKNTMTARAKDIKIDFDVTTQTWNTRPKFTISGRGVDAREIKTDSEIYHFVNGGTKAHIITAKNVPVLSFQSGYNAKTAAKQIASKQGGPYGPRVQTPAVQHPGTEAREFDLVIVEKWRKLLPNIFERAILSEL